MSWRCAAGQLCLGSSRFGMERNGSAGRGSQGDACQGKIGHFVAAYDEAWLGSLGQASRVEFRHGEAVVLRQGWRAEDSRGKAVGGEFWRCEAG